MRPPRARRAGQRAGTGPLLIDAELAGAVPETAAGAPRSAEPPDAESSLLTLPFVSILLVALLGFAQNFVLQPVLPLRIASIGGDAVVVGIAFAVFSIPSIVFRPQIGRLADRFGSPRVLVVGTAGIALMAPLYLVPSIAVVLASCTGSCGPRSAPAPPR